MPLLIDIEKKNSWKVSETKSRVTATWKSLNSDSGVKATRNVRRYVAYNLRRAERKVVESFYIYNVVRAFSMHVERVLK